LLAIFEPKTANGKFTTQTLDKRMAHPAKQKNTYWAQFGILMGLVGAGIVLGSVIQLAVMNSVLEPGALTKYSGKELNNKFFVPENANIIRILQFVSTFVMFCLPALLYARICHKQALTHLGFTHKVKLAQAGLVIVIMLACLPIVGALTSLTELLPFSKATFAKFKAAEDEYNAQVSIIGRMDNFPDFLLSLFMLAILPAIFEEIFFRGVLQNLFSRWWKMPVLAIIVTSVLFSAIHFSYLGFLSRAALGFILGWMFYRTGNIWLNIIAHGANNAVALTALYIAKQNDPNSSVSDADPNVPMWLGLVAVIVVYALFYLFERVSKYQINKPGEEVLIPYEDVNNPHWSQQSPNKDLFN